MKRTLAIFLFLIFSTAFGKDKHASQVHISIDLDRFQEKLSQQSPDWMKQQIHSDLSVYEKIGISKERLDQFFQGEQIDTLNLIRFTIKNRYLSFSLSKKNLEHRQFRHLLAAIEKLNTLVVLPNVDFIVSLEDGVAQDVGIPLFVYAKSKEASSLVLMPDFKAFTGYPTLRKAMEHGSQKWPWEAKITKAFWRGATTGGWLTSSNWNTLARVQLALLSKIYPNAINARLSSVVQCDSDIPLLIRSQGLTGKKVSQTEHLRYKYLIDVDGNSCSFERYFWTLLSNCVVLKQMTPNIQWYYGGLKPYEHFIPIKADLSDLLEKIQWAQTHDIQAKQIAENATAFIKEELSIEDVFIYMTHLLQEYAKLCRSQI